MSADLTNGEGMVAPDPGTETGDRKNLPEDFTRGLALQDRIPGPIVLLPRHHMAANELEQAQSSAVPS